MGDTSTKNKSSIVGFMDRKARLRDKLSKAVMIASKKTGVLYSLQSGLEKLGPKRMEQLEGDPNAAIGSTTRRGSPATSFTTRSA